jgi:Na+/H+ antiporter NhaD/arsenite permease-like protein
MKTVKVPVALVVIVMLLIVILIAYMYYQNSKVTEDIVSNERMKQENERLGLLANFKLTEQIEKFELREPIGFKLA